ncbi:hypothetical protein DM02DRAFT_677938 [Periconia macrospinosa]|uniref:Rhodopsin domain-containing protein n=1 Tax=Periconia macrospinosa TaxID=97972 RepID=A0A2V1D126_9PLEO|nr:hypothetical protein DM02DRAFT_677938 [Periconia macrospinosa]
MAQISPLSTPLLLKGYVDTVVVLTMVGVSLPFVLFRLYTRRRSFRRLFWDDFFVVLAWVLLMIIAVLAIVFRDDTREVRSVLSGEKWPPSAQFSSSFERFLRVGVAMVILFYTSLWSIKVGFLIFFRRLGTRKIRNLKIQWNLVFTITLLSYVACFLVLPLKCLGGSFSDLIAARCDRGNRVMISLAVGCSLDILDDLLVLSIPFTILWRVRLALKQKLVLFSIFSLVLVTIGFAVVRAKMSITRQAEGPMWDLAWNLIWCSLEAGISIIIACICSFRSLFTQLPQPNRYQGFVPNREPAYVSQSDTELQWLGHRPSESISGRNTVTNFENSTQLSTMTLSPAIQKPPCDEHSYIHRPIPVDAV